MASKIIDLMARDLRLMDESYDSVFNNLIAIVAIAHYISNHLKHWRINNDNYRI